MGRMKSLRFSFVLFVFMHRCLANLLDWLFAAVIRANAAR